MNRVVSTAVVAVLAWGVLTFGGVYPWAYWPLLSGAALCGLWLLFSVRRSRPSYRDVVRHRAHRRAAASSSARGSSALDRSDRAEEPRIPAGLRFHAQRIGRNHSVSVNTPMTRLTLCTFWSASSGSPGLARGLHTGVIKASTLVRAVTFLAVLVAIEALAQKATFNGKIYWFWESQFKVASNHFGPFVNRNHFAGWMLLALCLGSGYLGGRITLAGGRLKNSVRDTSCGSVRPRPVAS